MYDDMVTIVIEADLTKAKHGIYLIHTQLQISKER